MDYGSEYNPDWQSTLYNGLVTQNGKPVPVSSSNITKPMVENQIPEHMIPTLEVMSNNTRDRGLQRIHKQKFSIHRAMAFLPQE